MKIANVDNLVFMKELESNSVDLIYSDILYGTGRNFLSYKDLPTNRESIEEHYLPRLAEMYRVLKQGGNIFLQMDYTISHWIRVMLDELFSYTNFKNMIVWNRTNVFKNSSTRFPNSIDIILFYSKGSGGTFNPIIVEKERKVIDMSLCHTGYNGNRCERPNLYYPFYYGGEGKLTTDINKTTGEWSVIYPIDSNGVEKRWDWCRETAEKRIGELFVKNGRIYRRSKATKKEVVSCLWEYIGHDEKRFYPTQKPVELIKRIILAGSNEGDLVLDPYTLIACVLPCVQRTPR